MSQSYMEGLVAAVSEVEQHQVGYLQFLFKNVRMALISDAEHDRMRIIAPIISVADISEEQLYTSLESNFHQALDARYASSNGLLFSVYIHPISPLTEDQLLSALSQVATLAITFGEGYTSGELEYGSLPQQPEEQKNTEEQKVPLDEEL